MNKFIIISLEERIVLDAAAVAVAAGHVIYVNNAAPSAGADGQSWAHAFNSIQAALTEAASTPGADQIWVAKGTYTPTSGTDRSVSFNLPDNVALYGGFAGTETMLNQRNPSLNQTILSGDIGILNNNSDNSYTIVTLGNNGSVSATIDGFTISGANNDNPLSNGGGGISETNGSTLTVANDLFTNDRVADLGVARLTYARLGGGIYVADSVLNVSNSVFTNNFAKNGGAIGAISINGDFTVNVSGSTFTGNTNPLTTGSGGAISAGGTNVIDGNNLHPIAGHLNIDSSLFSNNSSRTGGGTFSFDILSETSTNTTYDHNQSIGFAGGAAHPEGNQSVTYLNDTFTNNFATLAGGAISDAFNANVLVRNSTFSNNSTQFAGGALDLEPGDGNVVVSFNTFSNNHATDPSAQGGVLYTFQDSNVTVFKNLFLDNSAGGQGGALFDQGSINYTVSQNTFSGNTVSSGPGNGPAIYLFGDETTVNSKAISRTDAILKSINTLNDGLVDDDIFLG